MADAKRPNVLIFMSDQHHTRFLGCDGHPLVQTPHMDRLAARGARFRNAYCNFPLCCPSRMSFMTARHTHDIDCMTNCDNLRTDMPTFAHAFSGGRLRHRPLRPHALCRSKISGTASTSASSPTAV